VLNESAIIGSCLERLRERAFGAEIIVVNGDSNDGTLDATRRLYDCVLTSARGWAVQMNTGAEAARSECFGSSKPTAICLRAAISGSACAPMSRAN
jgi:glycosyltransferase involved in cell wall biosynthesis